MAFPKRCEIDFERKCIVNERVDVDMPLKARGI